MKRISTVPDTLGLVSAQLLLWKVKVTQSCSTLCGPVDYTVHGILQARILEWVTFPFSRGSSQPRDWTQVSLIAWRLFTSWATREALSYCWLLLEVVEVFSKNHFFWSINFSIAFCSLFCWYLPLIYHNYLYLYAFLSLTWW